MEILFIIICCFAALLIILLIAQYIAERFFYNSMREEVNLVFKRITDPGITKGYRQSIDDLPDPARKYLQCVGVNSNSNIYSVRLKQKANIRLVPGSKGFGHTTEQYFSVDFPGFVWYASMKLFSGFNIKVRDKFYEGKGEMKGKALSLVNVVFANGPKIDQGALARYVGEMVWFPAAFLSNFCVWEEIDASSARLKVSINGVEVEGIFTFDENNLIKMFECQRWKQVNDKEMKTYRNYFQNYKEVEGYKIPFQGQALWHEDGNDFIYWDGEITEIEYNKNQLYSK